MTHDIDTLPIDTQAPVTQPVPGDIMSTEPARVIAWITGFAGAILMALIAFGLDLSHLQQGALLTLVGFVAPVIAGYVIRRRVVSPATAVEAANVAAETGITPPIMDVPKERWGTTRMAREQQERSPSTRHETLPRV